MKNIAVAKLFLTAAAILGATQACAAGDADNTWLKLNYTARNLVQINTVSGVLTKLPASRGTCYAQLCYVPTVGDVPAHYQATNHCQTSSTTWAPLTTDYELGAASLKENATGDAAYYTDGGLVFASYKAATGKRPIFLSAGNALLKISINSKGAFSRATWTGIGSGVVAGGLDETAWDPATEELMGAFSVTGSTVPISKLPFTPSPCP